MKSEKEYNNELYSKYPELKGKVFFSRHAAKRFNNRFSGKIPRSAGLAILGGISKKERQKIKKIVSTAHGADIVIVGKKDKNLIVTGWNNKENN